MCPTVSATPGRFWLLGYHYALPFKFDATGNKCLFFETLHWAQFNRLINLLRITLLNVLNPRKLESANLFAAYRLSCEISGSAKIVRDTNPAFVESRAAIYRHHDRTI